MKGVGPADNAALMGRIESVLDGGAETETLRNLLGSLQEPFCGVCVDVLVRVAREARDREVRARAVGLVGISGDPRAPALLRELLTFEDEWWHRINAVEALARCGGAGSAAAVLEALPFEEGIKGRVAERVALALALLGDEAALPALRKVLEATKSVKVRAAVGWLEQREAFLAKLTAVRGD